MCDVLADPVSVLHRRPISSQNCQITEADSSETENVRAAGRTGKVVELRAPVEKGYSLGATIDGTPLLVAHLAINQNIKWFQEYIVDAIDVSN